PARRRHPLPSSRRACGGDPWPHDHRAGTERERFARAVGLQRCVDAIVARSSAYLASVLRLVTIPISHYCEKARWALERVGLPYREERHVQGIHRLAARRAGGGTTVPVLVTSAGAIGESQEILEWIDERTPAERRLFPEEPPARERVQALCARLDGELGP